MLRTSREIEREAATEDAELLAARLEVERLREVIEDASSDPAACVDTVADLRAALAAPPPDLSPLRELVAATAGFAGTSADGTQGPIGRARDALLAAYPCLGDPECE
jgi:hypothetical protein